MINFTIDRIKKALGYSNIAPPDPNRKIYPMAGVYSVRQCGDRYESFPIHEPVKGLSILNANN